MYAATPTKQAEARRKVFSVIPPERRQEAAIRAAGGGAVVPIDAINPVYRPHLDNMARIQINYGGSSSGKSRFKAQQAVNDVLNNKRNWLVCRKIGKDHRGSTFVEIKDRVIGDMELTSRFKINETNMTITADTGYQIIFKGLDDLEKVKSIVPKKDAFTDIWVEEATQIDEDDLTLLIKRQRGGRADVPKRVHLTFNPILQLHWLYTKYFSSVAWADDQTEYNDGRLSILKTWYIHNEHLTPDDVYDLESETNEYFREVYTFGNWGVLGDVIFTNWEVRDLSDMRQHFTNHRFGLDFGFSAAPSAAPLTHYDKREKTIYIYDEVYERAATNDVLASLLGPLVGQYPIKCDSAESKSIYELKQHGINATGAKKGKDSVWHGIQWLQQQKIVIDKRCINTKNEFQQYQWAKDKHGNSTNIPVDKFNHAIDALRYAYEDDMVSYRVGSTEYA